MAAPMTSSSLRILTRFSQTHIASTSSRHHSTCWEHLKVWRSCFMFVPTRASTQFSKNSLQDSTKKLEEPTFSGVASADEMVRPNQQTSRTIPVSPDKAKQEKLLLQIPEQPVNASTLKVAIIGSPNAGKSTLINGIIGQRVFPVSNKVHTTRSNALAVLTKENTQIVLFDTPGMVCHKQGRKHHLTRSLLIDPKNSLEEAELALVLVDASNKWTSTKIANEILLSLHLHPEISSILVLNKVDLISKKHDLISLTALLTEGVINGVRFTIDDRTAQKKDASSDSVAKFELADGVKNGQGEEASSFGTSKISSDPPFHDSSQMEDLESKVEGLSNEAVNDEIKSDPRIPAISELPPTLAEYVSTLERFTSNSHNFEKPTQPGIAPTKAEVTNSEKERLRKILQEVEKRSGWDKFEAVFMVSALTGEGIDDVKEHLLSKAVPGNWEYHKNVLTNLSPEEILTEAIREKLLEYLPQEVPYNITQSNDFFETELDGKVRIIQKIICHKKSHLKMLKRYIGQIARETEQNLKDAFHEDVHLTLKIILR